MEAAREGERGESGFFASTQCNQYTLQRHYHYPPTPFLPRLPRNLIYLGVFLGVLSKCYLYRNAFAVCFLFLSCFFFFFLLFTFFLFVVCLACNFLYFFCSEWPDFGFCNGMGGKLILFFLDCDQIWTLSLSVND